MYKEVVQLQAMVASLGGFRRGVRQTPYGSADGSYGAVATNLPVQPSYGGGQAPAGGCKYLKFAHSSISCSLHTFNAAANAVVRLWLPRITRTSRIAR